MLIFTDFVIHSFGRYTCIDFCCVPGVGVKDKTDVAPYLIGLVVNEDVEK